MARKHGRSPGRCDRAAYRRTAAALHRTLACRYRSGRCRCTQRIRQWPLAAALPARALRGTQAGGRPLACTHAGAGRSMDGPGGCDPWLQQARVAAGAGFIRLLRRSDCHPRIRRTACVPQWWARACGAGTGRRGCGNHALERAAGTALLQGRRRAGGWLHSRGKALAGNADRCLRPGRARQRYRRAGRRVQSASRRPRGGRATDPPSACGQGQLYWLYPGGALDRHRLRRAPGAGWSGAGRQIGGDHAGRCRHRQGAAHLGALLHADRRAGVLFVDACWCRRSAARRCCRRIARH